MGKIIAICTSQKKGTAKKAVGQANIIENHGIEGDAHAGNWHRQVSLLSWQAIEAFKARGALEELLSFETRIDNLATIAFDLYVRSRDQIARMRVEETTAPFRMTGSRRSTPKPYFWPMAESISKLPRRPLPKA